MRCSSVKKKLCKLKNKTCNKKTGRCKSVKKKQNTKNNLIRERSYSPSVNKRFLSYKRYSKYSKLWDNNIPRIDKLFYKCDDDSIRINNKCLSYDNNEARQTMLNILALAPSSYQKASNIIAPKQSMRNCWLNAYFMCYFISDKGQKFFKQFRHIMITGISIDQTISIDEKYKLGLWYLNKLITACLFGLNYTTTKRFAQNANTNKILKLLKGSNETNSEKAIISPNVSYNPIMFYIDLFRTLHIDEGVQFRMINNKHSFEELFRSNDDGPNIELFIIERLDELTPNYLYSGDKPPAQSLMVQNKKYVLDAAVLRDVEKRHFTSYVTLHGKDYSFDGAANRSLRKFEWKNKLYSRKPNAWSFGSRRSDKNEKLEEKFDFSKGYQVLFYYLEGEI